MLFLIILISSDSLHSGHKSQPAGGQRAGLSHAGDAPAAGDGVPTLEGLDTREQRKKTWLDIKKSPEVSKAKMT